MATDPLFGTTAVSVTTTAVSTSSTASIAGECVVVTVGNIAATAQFAANASVRVRNTTSGITTGWQSCGLLFVGQIATLYHNIPVANGDTVVVDIIAPATITASKTTIAAVLTTTASSVVLRSDGRSLPLSSQVVAQAVASGTVTLVAAPPAGFRILAGAFDSAVNGSAGIGTFNVTINGVAVSFYTGLSSSDNIGAAGLLLDPATTITISFITGTLGAEAFYDIVPL
jgi:hypothetical protein